MDARIKEVFTRSAALVASLLSFGAWALLSLVLLGVVAVAFNPAKFGSYLWAVSKLSMAAVLGEGFYRAMTRKAPIEAVEGIERAMAQTQRATIIAAAIITAGLMDRKRGAPHAADTADEHLALTRSVACANGSADRCCCRGMRLGVGYRFADDDASSL